MYYSPLLVAINCWITALRRIGSKRWFRRALFESKLFRLCSRMFAQTTSWLGETFIAPISLLEVISTHLNYYIFRQCDAHLTTGHFTKVLLLIMSCIAGLRYVQLSLFIFQGQSTSVIRRSYNMLWWSAIDSQQNSKCCILGLYTSFVYVFESSPSRLTSLSVFRRCWTLKAKHTIYNGKFIDMPLFSSEMCIQRKIQNGIMMICK